MSSYVEPPKLVRKKNKKKAQLDPIVHLMQGKLLRGLKGFWLELQPGTGPTTPTEWSEETKPLVARVLALESTDLPEAFKLDRCVTITDPTAWLEQIQIEVARGPQSARARAGVLQQELRLLEGVLDAGS